MMEEMIKEDSAAADAGLVMCLVQVSGNDDDVKKVEKWRRQRECEDIKADTLITHHGRVQYSSIDHLLLLPLRFRFLITRATAIRGRATI
jgi:hypothetical protein